MLALRNWRRCLRLRAIMLVFCFLRRAPLCRPHASSLLVRRLRLRSRCGLRVLSLFAFLLIRFSVLQRTSAASASSWTQSAAGGYGYAEHVVGAADTASSFGAAPAGVSTAATEGSHAVLPSPRVAMASSLAEETDDDSEFDFDEEHLDGADEDNESVPEQVGPSRDDPNLITEDFGPDSMFAGDDDTAGGMGATMMVKCTLCGVPQALQQFDDHAAICRKAHFSVARKLSEHTLRL